MKHRVKSNRLNYYTTKPPIRSTNFGHDLHYVVLFWSSCDLVIFLFMPVEPLAINRTLLWPSMP